MSTDGLLMVINRSGPAPATTGAPPEHLAAHFAARSKRRSAPCDAIDVGLHPHLGHYVRHQDPRWQRGLTRRPDQHRRVRLQPDPRPDAGTLANVVITSGELHPLLTLNLAGNVIGPAGAILLSDGFLAQPEVVMLPQHPPLAQQ